ncbi:hypothetical protein [Streptococcus equinus]|uniref:hypothetical protein n=1 Tax=Streptococcus equinus TaxID=1335 RepID=UPI00088173B6|nr:hypothetical protein [Streptococcus equinus]QBX24715.1 hypothetical protein Javan202_0036 [Streptococcus phage Javan202]SDQ67108.1 hypothetical protein SAMN04488495_1800 [Streptococcus equinus]SEN67867.1 hypothetical protein SAMN04488496_0888 [Streptococcus equinus]
MNIKQLMIKGFKITKQQVPSYADEEKWHEACDKAIKLIEQLKEPDEAKMNLEELERANTLVQDIKILETLSKSEIEYLRVRYPDSRYDSVFMKDELKEKIQKVFEDYADELKAELKGLGVDYEYTRSN